MGNIQRKLVCIASLLLLSGSLSSRVVAQDAHYWTHQYGTRATLLGGAVIGSVLDLSATYYNPGMLPLIENPALILGAKVIEFTNIDIPDGGGDGVNLDAGNVSPAPSILAGRFKFGWLKDNFLGYSIFSRQKFKAGMDAHLEVGREMIGSSSDLNNFVGDVRLNVKLSEVWWGLTWARKLWHNIGFGVSQYVAVRSHRGRFEAIAQRLNTDSSAGLAIDAQEYKYRDWRTLWKFGLGIDSNNLTLGFSLTTSSLHLTGDGRAGVNQTVIGLDINNDGEEETFLANDLQDNVSSEYKTSVSVGFGASYKYRGTRVHGSAEWFAAVDEFDVLDTEPFVGQSSGDTLRNDVIHAMEGVLNFGIGIEQQLGKKSWAFASFATDFSGDDSDFESNLTLTNYDIYHIKVGTAFQSGASEFTLGIGYAFGDSDIERLGDIAGTADDNQIMITGNSSSVEYKQIQLILGFSF